MRGAPGSVGPRPAPGSRGIEGRASADWPSTRIDILPDHVHEGAVAIPRAFDPATWPRRNGFQAKPEIVAWGTNKAPLRLSLGLGASGVFASWREVGAVAAYDGEAVGVGRIVAHSTWHHFVNVNLVGFRNPDGSPGKVLARLGEYYANLAMWLSPGALRAAIHSEAATTGVATALISRRPNGTATATRIRAVSVANRGDHSSRRMRRPINRPKHSSPEAAVGSATPMIGITCRCPK